MWPATLRLRPQSKNYTSEGVLGQKQPLTIEKHGGVAWGYRAEHVALDGPCALRPFPALGEITLVGPSRVGITVRDATYIYNTHQPVHSPFSHFMLRLQKAGRCEAFQEEWLIGGCRPSHDSHR